LWFPRETSKSGPDDPQPRFLVVNEKSFYLTWFFPLCIEKDTKMYFLFYKPMFRNTLRKAIASVSATALLLGSVIVPGMGFHNAQAQSDDVPDWAVPFAQLGGDLNIFDVLSGASTNVTRREFFTAVGKALAVIGELAGTGDPIDELVAAGIVQGRLNADGSRDLALDDFILKEEALKTLLHGLGYTDASDEEGGCNPGFTDVLSAVWFSCIVQAAVDFDFSSGEGSTNFATWGAGKNLNRAEQFKLVLTTTDIATQTGTALDITLVAYSRSGGGSTPTPSGSVTFTSSNPALSISAGTLGSYPLTINTGGETITEIYAFVSGANTSVDLSTATFVFDDGGRGNSQSFSNDGNVTLAGMRIQGNVSGQVKVAYKIGATANTNAFFSIVGYKTSAGAKVMLDVTVALGSAQVNGFIPPVLNLTPSVPPQTLYIGGYGNIQNFNLRNVASVSSDSFNVRSVTFRAPTSTDFNGPIELRDQITTVVVGCSLNGVVGTYYTIKFGIDCEGNVIVGMEAGLLMKTGESRNFAAFSEVSSDANVVVGSVITVDSPAIDLDAETLGGVRVPAAVLAGIMAYTIAAGNMSFNTFSTFGPEGLTNLGTPIVTVRQKSFLTGFVIDNLTGAESSWQNNNTALTFVASAGGVPFATGAAACAAFAAAATNFAFDIIDPQTGSVTGSIFSTLGPQVCAGAVLTLTQAGTKTMPTGQTAFVLRADLTAGAAGATFAVTLGSAAGGLSAEFFTAANRVFAAGTLPVSVTSVTKVVSGTPLTITVNAANSGGNFAPGDMGQASFIFTNTADTPSSLSAFVFALAGFDGTENNFTLHARNVGDTEFTQVSSPVPASGAGVTINTLTEQIKTGTLAGNAVEVKVTWNYLSSTAAGLRTITLTALTVGDIDGNIVVGFAVPGGLASLSTVLAAGVVTLVPGATQQADYIGTGETKDGLVFDANSTGIDTIFKTIPIVFISGNGASANVTMTALPTNTQTITFTGLTGATPTVTITFITGAANAVSLLTAAGFSIGINAPATPASLAATIRGITGTAMTFLPAPNETLGGFTATGPVPAAAGALTVGGTAATTVVAEAAGVAAVTIDGSKQYSSLVLRITRSGQTADFTFTTSTAAGANVQGLTAVNDQNSTNYKVMAVQNAFTTGLAVNGGVVVISIGLNPFAVGGAGLAQAINGVTVNFNSAAITGNTLIGLQSSLELTNPGQSGVSTLINAGQSYIGLKLKVEKSGEGIPRLNQLVVAITVSDAFTTLSSVLLEDTTGRLISTAVLTADPVGQAPIALVGGVTPIPATGAFAVFTVFLDNVQDTGDFQIRVNNAAIGISQSMTLTIRGANVGQTAGVNTFSLFGISYGILKDTIFSASSQRTT
jgi:hypothetical protein